MPDFIDTYRKCWTCQGTGALGAEGGTCPRCNGAKRLLSGQMDASASNALDTKLDTIDTKVGNSGVNIQILEGQVASVENRIATLEAASVVIQDTLDVAADVVNYSPIFIFPPFYDSITQGIFLANGQSNHWFGTGFHNDTFADGDQVNYLVYMGVGAYTFRLLHAVAAQHGIVQLLIDNVEIANFDHYRSPAAYNIVDVATGIEIAEAGIKTLSLKINGKSASSSGHYMNIAAIYLHRTI